MRSLFRMELGRRGHHSSDGAEMMFASPAKFRSWTAIYNSIGLAGHESKEATAVGRHDKRK